MIDLSNYWPKDDQPKGKLQRILVGVTFWGFIVCLSCYRYIKNELRDK